MFCPLFFKMKVVLSVIFFVLSVIFFVYFIINYFFSFSFSFFFSLKKNTIFVKESSLQFIAILIFIACLNVMSLMIYTFPVTTSLFLNLSVAFLFWFTSIVVFFFKKKPTSFFLPVNSPWYLVPFLSFVEMVSLLVRPITLCFRLLANMTAGHVLLTLICKMPFIWVVGASFFLLEVMVSFIQSFVFTMLSLVYVEESLNH